MTKQEHLQRIRDRCVELLAMRTQGKRTPNSAWNQDAAFIAACAGSAEAGWLTTMAAIDAVPVTCRGANASFTSRESLLIDTILAAWPEELL